MALADDACLVVSELVTNSLLHGGGAPLVRAALRPGGLRLEVTDPRASGAHVVTPEVPDAPGGLGFIIVEGHSASWGITPDTPGATVWVELAGGDSALI